MSDANRILIFQGTPGSQQAEFRSRCVLAAVKAAWDVIQAASNTEQGRGNVRFAQLVLNRPTQFAEMFAGAAAANLPDALVDPNAQPTIDALATIFQTQWTLLAGTALLPSA